MLRGVLGIWVLLCRLEGAVLAMRWVLGSRIGQPRISYNELARCWAGLTGWLATWRFLPSFVYHRNGRVYLAPGIYSRVYFTGVSESNVLSDYDRGTRK